MGKRKPSARTERRARAHVHEELVRDLEELARVTPGGTPTRPIDVESPAQVEPIVQATACPLCDGTVQLTEHAVRTQDGERLRVARVRCTQCGVDRELYFRLASPLLN